MKAKATVALPKSCSPETRNKIKGAEFSFIDIEYLEDPDIAHPIARSFSRNDTDLGSIDGDREEPSMALLSGIHLEANRIFNSLERARS